MLTMMKTEPLVANKNGTLTVNIDSIHDALAIQKAISDSISMALADGRTGRANGICIRSEKPDNFHQLRFQVSIGKSESNTIAFYNKVDKAA